MAPKLRLRWIAEVWRKELLSTLRDRRAIVSNLLIPLLVLPVMMLGLPLLLGGLFEREQETQTDLAIHGESLLPDALAEQLARQNLRLVAYPSEADVGLAVRGDEAPVGLVVPDDLAAAVRDGGAALTLYTKVGNLRSEVNAGKVRAAVEGYRQGIVADRLRAAGLDPAVLRPVTLQSVDASSEAERSSGQLSWLIPFFIAIWTLTGGQMTALDATAGEKERGTLEALLVTPIRRSEVVLGKFLATLTTGLSAATMAIVGYVLGGAIVGGWLVGRLGDEGAEMALAMGGALDVTFEGVVLLLASSVLLSGLIAAILIAVTMFARSIKEAQSADEFRPDPARRRAAVHRPHRP